MIVIMQGSRVRIPHEPVTVYAEQTSAAKAAATVYDGKAKEAMKQSQDICRQLLLAVFLVGTVRIYMLYKNVEHLPNKYRQVLFILQKKVRRT